MLQASGGDAAHFRLRAAPGRMFLARLIPLLLALAAFVIFFIARHQASRPRDDRTYRPRSSGARGGFDRGSAETGNWIASRAEIDGVRDAYSSAALDPARGLHRCGGCQAYYHDASVAALASDNGGRCALCGSADLRPVRVV
jgi:hypothetical protein